MKKRFSNLIVLSLMAMMIATSCKDEDGNDPEPIPEPTPVEEKDFHAVPLSITVNIEPVSGSIDGVETKKAFASGDVIEISNPDVLYEPLSITVNDGVGKSSANFTAELKVKKGVELVSGSTKFSAVLKNGSNYNNGKSLSDVKAIDKPADGLDQYCSWSCEGFTYSSAANTISLAQSTVFVELNMINDNVTMKIGNAEFSETIAGSRLFAIPSGIKIEIPNANFEMQLDGKKQSIYHITASAPEECLPHLFSIGEDKHVFFSCGNLQYRPMDGTWRIAPQQYLTGFGGCEVGFDFGENFSEWMGEDKWTDLFRGGAWIEGGSPNIVNAGDADYTLPVDQNDEVNAPCAYGAQWMVLSSDEWSYLMEKRPDYQLKRGGAVVEGVEGWMILPDDWSAPDGMSFVPDFSVKKIEEIPNQYTKDEWAVMEAAGAVFLPNSGQFMMTWYAPLSPCYQTRNVTNPGVLGMFLYFSRANECYCYGQSSPYDFGNPVRLVQLQVGNTRVKVE